MVVTTTVTIDLHGTPGRITTAETIFQAFHIVPPDFGAMRIIGHVTLFAAQAVCA